MVHDRVNDALFVRSVGGYAVEMRQCQCGRKRRRRLANEEKHSYKCAFWWVLLTLTLEFGVVYLDPVSQG